MRRLKKISAKKIHEKQPEPLNQISGMTRGPMDSPNKQVLREANIFSELIRDAIRFSIKTHEGYQKQKRKGKDIPYITHPLTVGLILSRAGAGENAITAGILHDTIEDSVAEHKVTREMLSERFGPAVADIVRDVTEPNKKLPWKERKRSALNHIKTFQITSALVKSADVISNVSELLDDYKHDGKIVFARFNASGKDVIANYRAVINVLLEKLSIGSAGPNPIISDLKTLADELVKVAEAI